MKIGIIIGTKEPEVVINGLRFGLALRNGHHVWVFLVKDGVDVEDIESISFNVREQVFLFTRWEGRFTLV